MKDFLVSILKLFLLLAAIGAAIYAVIMYWEKIAQFLCTTKEKVSSVAASCCGSEFDDYEDWQGE